MRFFNLLDRPRMTLTRFFLSQSLIPLVGLPLSVHAQDAAVRVADQAAATSAVESIEVVGRREAGSYVAGEASGTQSKQPLRELPQAVRVMTRQSLDDLAAVRLDDVLDYVGGVSRQNNFGGLWDNIAIRGLAGNENSGMSTLLNGFAGNRGFNAPRDTAQVERVEFLKGPAAALYGSSEPGGTLNLVTKKPMFRPGAAVDLQAGSYGFRRVAIDATGPFSNSVAGRINAVHEDRAGFRHDVDTQRTLISPALVWKPSAATRLDYFGEWLKHATPLDRGVVAINNTLGAVPREQFLGEPADGPVKITNLTHQLTLRHDFDNNVFVRAGLSYRTGTLNGFSTEATALQADQKTLRRQRRFRDYDSTDLAAQIEAGATIQTGTIAHELLVGLERYRYRVDQLLLRVNPTAASPYAIDVFNPVYGQPKPTLLPNTDTREHQRNTALYVQDVVVLSPRWRALAGLRLDQYDQSLDNRRNNTRAEQSPSKTSPRLGLSYLPDAQWSLYANGGRSFRPNAGNDVRGSAFAPESGRALELGVKWESLDKRLGATWALFDIRKDNVVTSDPVNPGFSIAAGEVRSRGMEFDLAGQVTRQLRVNASLVMNDVEVLRDNTLEVGGRLLNVPRVNGSVLAVHEFALDNGQGMGLGAGATYVGKRLGEARTAAQAASGAAIFDLPAYTTAKLLWFWRLSPQLRVNVDIDNLFDRPIYTSSFNRVWITPGAPRTVTLGLQARY